MEQKQKSPYKQKSIRSNMFDDQEEAHNMRTGQKLDLETGNVDVENIEPHENAIY